MNAKRVISGRGPMVLALTAGTLAALLAPTAALGQTPAGDVAAKGADAAVGAEAMPLRKITLYRSGVGAFERQGLITGRQRVGLRFDVSQINDIIKSLQIVDLDKGLVEAVSYPSKDPLARRLNSFSVPIADAPSLPDLLGRLRGSRVEVETPGSKLSGTILSVESRMVPGPREERPIQQPFLNVVTETGIRTVAIPSITNLQLSDKELSAELARALGVVADARAERVKNVDMTLSGDGARRVVVRYVHETPVWKTSYRLVIPDAAEGKAGDGKGGEAKAGDGKGGEMKGDSLALQGWAIVENTTDQDWRDVRLSLVSGRPVSFQMDLSQPLYLARPDVPVPTIPGVAPREFAGGVNPPPAPTAMPAVTSGAAIRGTAGEMGAPGNPGGGGGGRMAQRAPRAELRESAAKGAPDGAMAGLRVMEDLSGSDLANYSPAAQARAGEAGEVFFYEVSTPVTVERQRSAMIPFLSAPVTGRRVSIFNPRDGSKHPLRGVEMTNSSSLQLLPGPIAVFDGAAYAGDATIGQVSPGDKRLLAYAIDLEVEVLAEPYSVSDLTKLRIVDGVFEQTTKSRMGTKFTLANRDAKRGRTVVLEQPKMSGWDLVQPAKPAEVTQDLYRFEVGIEAAKSAAFEYAVERTESQRLEIGSFGLDQLVAFRAQGKVSEAVVNAVRELSKKQATLADAERQLGLIDQQINTNTNEQTRISQTIKGLPQNSDLVNDYLKELRELNTKLRELRTNREKASQTVETARAAVTEYVRNLKAE